MGDSDFSRESVGERNGRRITTLLGQDFHLQCWACDQPIDVKDSDEWLAGAKTIPPTRQISTLQCTKCGETTCAGCGKKPNFDNANFWTSLGVINHCCEGGKAFGLLYLLTQLDNEDLEIAFNNPLAARPAAVADPESSTASSSSSGPKVKAQKNDKVSQNTAHLQSGIGYAPEHAFMGGFGHDGFSPTEMSDEYIEEWEYLRLGRLVS